MVAVKQHLLLHVVQTEETIVLVIYLVRGLGLSVIVIVLKHSQWTRYQQNTGLHVQIVLKIVIQVKDNVLINHVQVYQRQPMVV